MEMWARAFVVTNNGGVRAHALDNRRRRVKGRTGRRE
jgi:hypothetical protein